VRICDRDILEIIYGPAIDWTNWEGITYTLFDNRGITAYEPAQTLDQAGLGRLQAPFSESLILAYEAQILPQTSLELSYVDKQTNDMIEDTCGNNTWAWGDGEPPSLDDPFSWTTAEGCSQYIVANVPGFGREYQAFILRLETRRENYYLQASVTRADSQGNTFNGASETYATELADFYPLHFVNRQGYLPDHRELRLKTSGYWLLPHDFRVGFEGWWSSAGHISPSALCSNYAGASRELHEYYGYDTSMYVYCFSPDGLDLSSTNQDLYLQPRGSFETKPVWDFDLQLTKGFRVGNVDLSAILAIYNIFGRELDSSFNSTAYLETFDEELGEPVYDDDDGELIGYYVPIGQPLSWRQPRRYELGFRIEF
jgi:hypothetical protein